MLMNKKKKIPSKYFDKKDQISIDTMLHANTPSHYTFKTYSPFFLLSWAYLHSQTQRVEHNEEEHEVLEVAGGDNVPHPVLVGVLGDVAPQRPSL